MSIILSLSIYICSKFATLCCNVISLFITNYILHQSFYVHHLITLLFPFLLFSHLSKICYIFHSCFCNTIFFLFLFFMIHCIPDHVVRALDLQDSSYDYVLEAELERQVEVVAIASVAMEVVNFPSQHAILLQK